MERIYIDSIGPLTEDSKGNKYIIVIIDGFTRWVELYPVPDVTAEVTARVALMDWVDRFGVPAQIMTDNGTQFANQIWEQLSLLLGSEKLNPFPIPTKKTHLSSEPIRWSSDISVLSYLIDTSNSRNGPLT